MRVLIVGSGGREHALAWKIAQSPLLSKLFCAPGNPGTAEVAENLPISGTDVPALLAAVKEHKIDLTIVGPEAPLDAGIADRFTAAGFAIFGPVKAAAQLETSKAFAKEVMLKAGVRTASAKVCRSHSEAVEYVRSHGAPVVIKADGLAAGKGVVVAFDLPTAISTLDQFMLRQQFGASSTTVLIEDFLEGQEASVIAIVCGDQVLPLVVSQDHKRLLDNDQGPNTGGVGAVSPVPVLSEKRLPELIETIFRPVILELRRRGTPYTGFLYAGVMVSPSGEVSVIEFNCRLGDPETQVILMRLKSDLLPVLDAAARSNGDRGPLPAQLEWYSDAAACVVACSRGYPEKVDDGKIISGVFSAEPDLVVFQAGTARDRASGHLLSAGGRVLGVTARGDTVRTAVARAYDGISRICFEGMHCRKDIGNKSTG